MGLNKALFVGLGSFVVLGSLMGPAKALMPQSLVEKGTAVGVSSDLARRAGSNVLGARDRALKLAKGLNERTGLADEVMGAATEQAGSAASQRLYTSDQVLAQHKKDPKGLDAEMLGQRVVVKGTVIRADKENGFDTVLIAPAGSKDDSKAFLFQIPTGSQAFQVGQDVTLEGTYRNQFSDDGAGGTLFVIDGDPALAPRAGGDVSAPPVGGPVEEEAPYGGWRFLGAVEDEAGATGVFERDGETVYAQAGEWLDKEFRVEGVKAGEAVIRGDGSSLVIANW